MQESGLYWPCQSRRGDEDFDSEFDVAAVDVSAGQVAPVPCGDGVGPLGVARQLERRECGQKGAERPGGNREFRPLGTHPDLPHSTAEAQLPKLLTERHLSAGR